MTTEKQSEALRLADRLCGGDWYKMPFSDMEAAGRELRRLQAENEGLRAQVEALTRDTERQASEITRLWAELKDREIQHRVDRTRLQTIYEHQAKECWYWQGDGQDNLKSLVGSLPVVIRADELRELLAEAEALSKDAARWHWLSDHMEVHWSEGKFTSLLRIVSEKWRASINASVDRMMAGDWSDADAPPQSQSKPTGADFWKHDCSAIRVNDLPLWVDSCRHCGNQRPSPQPMTRPAVLDSSWLRQFLGKGGSLVRALYNDPKDEIDASATGDWIQTASQLLTRPAVPESVLRTGFSAEDEAWAFRGMTSWQVWLRACRWAEANLLAAAPQPEAVTTAPCKGLMCGCTDGLSHSLECQAEHSAAIVGGRFIKDAAPQPEAQKGGA